MGTLHDTRLHTFPETCKHFSGFSFPSNVPGLHVFKRTPLTPFPPAPGFFGHEGSKNPFKGGRKSRTGESRETLGFASEAAIFNLPGAEMKILTQIEPLRAVSSDFIIAKAATLAGLLPPSLSPAHSRDGRKDAAGERKTGPLLALLPFRSRLPTVRGPQVEGGCLWVSIPL